MLLMVFTVMVAGGCLAALAAHGRSVFYGADSGALPAL